MRGSGFRPNVDIRAARSVLRSGLHRTVIAPPVRDPVNRFTLFIFKFGLKVKKNKCNYSYYFSKVVLLRYKVFRNLLYTTSKYDEAND